MQLNLPKPTGRECFQPVFAASGPEVLVFIDGIIHSEVFLKLKYIFKKNMV